MLSCSKFIIFNFTIDHSVVHYNKFHHHLNAPGKMTLRKPPRYPRVVLVRSDAAWSKLVVLMLPAFATRTEEELTLASSIA